MLEQLLTSLNNWFPAPGGRHTGTFEIVSGAPRVDFLAPGQYYRVRGSTYNDGLHQAAVPPSSSDGAPSGESAGAHVADIGHDETFTGEVWALAIPAAVVALADEIAAWREKNPETDKLAESFGGYSYTRGGGAQAGWQAAFAARMRPYRRIYDD